MTVWARITDTAFYLPPQSTVFLRRQEPSKSATSAHGEITGFLPAQEHESARVGRQHIPFPNHPGTAQWVVT